MPPLSSSKPVYTLREVRRFAVLYGRKMPAQGFKLPPRQEIISALAQGLTPDSLPPVVRLMETLDNGTNLPSPLCYEALRASYRVVRLLDNMFRFRETGGGSTYLKDLRRQVIAEHYLSPRQIARLNANLKKFDRKIMPEIQGDSFKRSRPHLFIAF